MQCYQRCQDPSIQAQLSEEIEAIKETGHERNNDVTPDKKQISLASNE